MNCLRMEEVMKILRTILISTLLAGSAMADGLNVKCVDWGEGQSGELDAVENGDHIDIHLWSFFQLYKLTFPLGDNIGDIAVSIPKDKCTIKNGLFSCVVDSPIDVFLNL